MAPAGVLDDGLRTILLEWVRVYSDLGAGFAYAAIEYISSIQLCANRSQVHILAFKLER